MKPSKQVDQFRRLVSQLSSSSAPIRVIGFLVVLALVWLPIALPLYLWLGTTTSLSVMPLILLYGLFVVGLQIWGKRVHHHSKPLQAHGLVKSTQSWRELLTGIVLGVVSLGLLFGIEGWLGWLQWQAVPLVFWRILLEGFLVGLGVSLAEELVFRGWLLDELRYDWGFSRALWASSLVYAALHFIKPWQDILEELPSFPGLLLLGLVLGWARQRTKGRLGLAMGLHGGLVWGYYLVDVGDLASYTQVVPDWVTGINQNPLAGAVGVVFLSVIAALLRQMDDVTESNH